MNNTTQAAIMSLVLLAGMAGGWIVTGFWKSKASIPISPTTQQAYPRPPRPPNIRNASSPVSDQTRLDWESGLETAADCLRLVESLRDWPRSDHPLFISALRDYALRRWLELDPEEALSFAENAGGQWYDSTLAGDLFGLWVCLDPDSALNAYSQASPATIMAARRDFFTKLAESDPQRALDEMDHPRWKATKVVFDEQIKDGIYAIWAETNPLSAAQRAIEKQEGYNSTLVRVADTWAQQDPETAWKFFESTGILSMTEGRRYPDSLAAVLLSYLVPTDPTALERAPIAVTRELARTWTDRNPEDAIAFAQSRPADDLLRRELLAHAARNIATAEPEPALQLHRESGGGSAHDWENSGFLREALASLAARDRDQAGLKALEFSGKDREAAMAGVLTHAFASDLAGASALARSWLADPSLKEAVLPSMHVALSWGNGGGNHDLGPILERVPELADHLSGYPLQGWSRTDPEAAAAFLKAQVSTNPNLPPGDLEAVAEICFSRPEFTSQWIMELPAGPFQASTGATLAKAWSRFDPEAASTWARSLPEGATKEAALEALGASSGK